VESLDGDGQLVGDLDSGLADVVPGDVFEFADLHDNPCVPFISGLID